MHNATLKLLFCTRRNGTPRHRTPVGPRRYDLQDVAIRRYSRSTMLHWDGVNAAAPLLATLVTTLFMYMQHTGR